MSTTLALLLVLAVQCSLHHLQALAAASQECELSGYDLSTLSGVDYWTIEVQDTADCMVPLGTTVDELRSCNIYTSICKSLGSTVCPEYPASTMCQEVITVQGDVYHYDMGSYMSNTEFQPLNGNDVGFQASRYAQESVESEECNGKVSTNLYFICDPDSIWSADDSDVTRHVMASQQDLSDPCTYAVELRYNGACYTSTTVSPSHCNLEDYDIDTLASREYWTATVDASACYNSDDESCIMFLAFCHSVPSEIGETCSGSAICQKGRSDNGLVLELSMGRFTNFTHFYENDEQGENAGFHMKVENGSRPENGTVCKDGIQSEVILVCDQSKEWNSQDISEFVQLAYHHGEDPCMYIVKIGYNGACSSGGNKYKSRASPVGWIFIGLFGFVVVSYVVVGSSIMYFVKGERGLRIFPHYEFWQTFIILIMGGCKYFLDIVTCYRFNGSKVQVRTQQQPDYDRI